MAILITVVELNTKGFNSDGTTFTELLYFSSHPYTPIAGPKPGGVADIDPEFNPRILTDPLKAFSMGCAAFCSNPVQTLGDLELDNAGGELQYLLTRDSKGLEANYYLGFDDQAFSTFEPIASLIQNEFLASAEDRIKLSFIDRLGKLQEAIPLDKYDDTVPNVALQNTFVPEVWGKIKGQRLEPYDKANEIFVVSKDGDVTSFDTVRDNGVGIPVGVPPTASTYAVITTSEGYTAVQFVSNTTGVITVECKSSEAPGIDIIFDRIAAKYSLTIDSATMVLFDERNNRNVGALITDSTPGADVLNGILKCVNGWYYQDNAGDIKVGQLKEPEGNPAIFIDRNNAIGDFFINKDKAPGLRGSVSGQKNWFIHEDGQVAASVADVARGQLTKAFRYTFSDLGDDIELHPDYAFALDAQPLETTINNTTQMVNSLKAHVAHYGGRRWFYQMGAIIDAQVLATLEPGDTVALHQEDFDLVDPYDIDVHGQPLATSAWLLHEEARLFSATGDNAPEYNILENMSTIQFTGNNWKTFEYPYTITAGTLLEFDFQANTDSKGSPQINEGEIIGIGMCSTQDLSTAAENDKWFQIHGTQSYAIQDYNNLYTNDSGWRRYVIPIGEHFTGYFAYLRLVADYDNYNALTRKQDTRFRNVRLREAGYLNTALIAGEFSLGANELKLTTWGA